MGRWSYSTKTEADGLLKVDVYWLKKNGYLHPYGWKSGGIQWTSGWNGQKSSISFEVNSALGSPEKYIRLYYQTGSGDEKKSIDYKVPLVTTPCNYGGVRYWFICPLSVNGKYCGKRVGTLYKVGDYFGCRHSHDLTYDSKKENRRYKMYPLFSTLLAHKKMDELESKIKHRYYAGKPTRKQRKLDKLQRSILSSSIMMKKEGLI